MAAKRRFGRVRRLPSGRYQARYRGPDGIDRPAPTTFERKSDADRWLARVEQDILRDEWTDPDGARVTVREYAETWLRERTDLRPKTRQLYEGLIRLHLVPRLGEWSIGDLRQPTVRSWRAALVEDGVGDVTVAKAYRLLRTIMATAVDDRLVRVNPCGIKGAGKESSAERPALTVDQVFQLANAITPRYRLLVLLATFCSMRWGELAALRRSAVDLDGGFVVVRESLSEMGDGSLIFGRPKTDAGRRVVAIPPSLIPDVRRHLDLYVGESPSALVFAGPKGAAPRRSNFQSHWRRASVKAELPPGVHFHDLRHTGNTLAAQAGATLSDLMARMGHAGTRMAKRYMHTSQQRDQYIAGALDRLLPTEVSGTQGARESSDA